MEELKKVRVFFDQDLEAVIKKFPLDGMMKKIAGDAETIFKHFDIILEKVKNFFEEVKNDEDYKALMAKYEIENKDRWLSYAFFIYNAYLCDREIRRDLL